MISLWYVSHDPLWWRPSVCTSSEAWELKAPLSRSFFDIIRGEVYKAVTGISELSWQLSDSSSSGRVEPQRVGRTAEERKREHERDQLRRAGNNKRLVEQVHLLLQIANPCLMHFRCAETPPTGYLYARCNRSFWSSDPLILPLCRVAFDWEERVRRRLLSVYATDFLARTSWKSSLWTPKNRVSHFTDNHIGTAEKSGGIMIVWDLLASRFVNNFYANNF